MKLKILPIPSPVPSSVTTPQTVPQKTVLPISETSRVPVKLSIKPVVLKVGKKVETKKVERKEEEEETGDGEELEDYDDTNSLFEGDLVELGEAPKTPSWKFPALFKEGISGEICVWQVGFESNQERLKTVYGKLMTSKGERGKLVVAYHPIVTNNSGRTLQQQATLEARKRYLDQYESKQYFPRGVEVPQHLKGKGPMLAHKLKMNMFSGTGDEEDDEEDEDGDKCKKISLDRFPVNVSAKIDGIRNLSKLTSSGEVFMRSRNNKPHTAPLTHIKKELAVFMRYLPHGSEVDGELYIPGVDFNIISGIIRTKKGVHKRHDEIKYFIFDIIEPQEMPWEHRYNLLVAAMERYKEDGHPNFTFEVVKTYSAGSEEEIIKYHDVFVGEGYEGIMIRRYAKAQINSCCFGKLENKDYSGIAACKKCSKGFKLSLYKPNKNNNLLKHKKFIDKEVEIIGAETGVGTEEGAIVYKVKDEYGNIFTVRPMGTVDERRELYKNRAKLIGKQLTIRYQQLSKDKVPRFPVGVAIRDYE